MKMVAVTKASALLFLIGLIAGAVISTSFWQAKLRAEREDATFNYYGEPLALYSGVGSLLRARDREIDREEFHERMLVAWHRRLLELLE